MRYEKADNLLQLALEMQARRGGISLQEIEQSFDVGRRTAMRMRDAILRNFLQAEEVATDERVKRWRIPAGVLDHLVAFSADELAAMETAIGVMRQQNREDVAADLETVVTKIHALVRPEVARRVEPDLEALLEAEGLAMRPGPRPRIKVMVVEDLRRAIKGGNRVKLSYRRRKDNEVHDRIVNPYGFLHGHRHYLVGWHEHPQQSMMLTFALPRIEKVEVLDDMFERDPDFSLKTYAERSFGLFHEEPFDVVWRFTPDAADEAEQFVFHPSQKTERQEDGALIVRFRAGSDMEMAWYLYMWGDRVEVLAPQRLAEMVRECRPSWVALP